MATSVVRSRIGCFSLFPYAILVGDGFFRASLGRWQMMLCSVAADGHRAQMISMLRKRRLLADSKAT